MAEREVTDACEEAVETEAKEDHMENDALIDEVTAQLLAAAVPSPRDTTAAAAAPFAAGGAPTSGIGYYDFSRSGYCEEATLQPQPNADGRFAPNLIPPLAQYFSNRGFALADASRQQLPWQHNVAYPQQPYVPQPMPQDVVQQMPRQMQLPSSMQQPTSLHQQTAIQPHTMAGVSGSNAYPNTWLNPEGAGVVQQTQPMGTRHQPTQYASPAQPWGPMPCYEPGYTLNPNDGGCAPAQCSNNFNPSSSNGYSGPRIYPMLPPMQLVQPQVVPQLPPPSSHGLWPAATPTQQQPATTPGNGWPTCNDGGVYTQPPGEPWLNPEEAAAKSIESQPEPEAEKPSPMMQHLELIGASAPTGQAEDPAMAKAFHMDMLKEEDASTDRIIPGISLVDTDSESTTSASSDSVVTDGAAVTSTSGAPAGGLAVPGDEGLANYQQFWLSPGCRGRQAVNPVSLHKRGRITRSRAAKANPSRGAGGPSARLRRATAAFLEPPIDVEGTSVNDQRELRAAGAVTPPLVRFVNYVPRRGRRPTTRSWGRKPASTCTAAASSSGDEDDDDARTPAEVDRIKKVLRRATKERPAAVGGVPQPAAAAPPTPATLSYVTRGSTEQDRPVIQHELSPPALDVQTFDALLPSQGAGHDDCLAHRLVANMGPPAVYAEPAAELRTCGTATPPLSADYEAPQLEEASPAEVELTPPGSPAGPPTEEEAAARRDRVLDVMEEHRQIRLRSHAYPVSTDQSDVDKHWLCVACSADVPLPRYGPELSDYSLLVPLHPNGMPVYETDCYSRIHCELCGSVFPSEKSRAYHESVTHLVNPIACFICGFYSDTWLAASEHRLNHEARGEHRCWGCADGSGDHRRLTPRHWSIHSPQYYPASRAHTDGRAANKWVCPLCLECFASRSALRSHVSALHDDPPLLRCSLHSCPFTTRSMHYLRVHDCIQHGVPYVLNGKFYSK